MDFMPQSREKLNKLSNLSTANNQIPTGKLQLNQPPQQTTEVHRADVREEINLYQPSIGLQIDQKERLSTSCIETTEVQRKHTSETCENAKYQQEEAKIVPISTLPPNQTIIKEECKANSIISIGAGRKEIETEQVSNIKANANY